MFTRVAALSVVAVCAAPAFAQDAGAANAEAERLRSCLFYVQKVEGAERAWGPFVENVTATVGKFAEGDDESGVPTPLRAARDDIFWVRSKDLLNAGPAGMEGAYPLLDVLDDRALDPKRKAEANESCYQIHMAWGQAAEEADDENKALENYYAAAARVPDQPAPWRRVGDLSRKKATADVKEQDFTAALGTLNNAKSGLQQKAPAGAGTAAIGEIDADIERILSTTGEIRVAWLGRPEVLAKVPGGSNDFRKARLQLTPRDGGLEPPEQVVGTPMRVRNGAFDVVAAGSSGALPLPGALDVSKDGAEVVMPLAIPDGMVLVPAGAGLDAFLIDRTEVSVAEFKAFAAGSGAGYTTIFEETTPATDDMPVAGVTFEHAVAYADSLGKKLPSRDQWVYACFGATDEDWDPAGDAPKYPWGGDDPRAGTHGFLDRAKEDGPGPADGCEAGASAFSGCINMAFNVWEWLDDAWAIGGAFNLAETDRTVETESGEWGADYLRDAAPSPAAYDKLNEEQLVKYINYQVRRGTLDRVGLRCVLTLGPPWRE